MDVIYLSFNYALLRIKTFWTIMLVLQWILKTNLSDWLSFWLLLFKFVIWQLSEKVGKIIFQQLNIQNMTLRKKPLLFEHMTSNCIWCNYLEKFRSERGSYLSGNFLKLFICDLFSNTCFQWCQGFFSWNQFFFAFKIV